MSGPDRHEGRRYRTGGGQLGWGGERTQWSLRDTEPVQGLSMVKETQVVEDRQQSPDTWRGGEG